MNQPPSAGSARVESEVDQTSVQGEATLKTHVRRSNESSARVASSGTVATGADGETEVDVSGDTTADASTKLDGDYRETSPTGPFGTPRVATGTSKVDQSTKSRTSWDAKSDGGETEVTVNSSSETESGSFEFSGGEESGHYLPGDGGAQPEEMVRRTTEWTVSGGPHAPTVSTTLEGYERFRKSSDSFETLDREDSIVEKSMIGGEGSSATASWATARS